MEIIQKKKGSGQNNHRVAEKATRNLTINYLPKKTLL